MSEKCLAVVEINQDLCSQCCVCHSICPYEAIPREIEHILKDQGFFCGNSLPLRVPCSGRIPTDFIFKVLNSGVKNIVSIQCEDAFCRMKEGTKINARRFQLSRNVLQRL